MTAKPVIACAVGMLLSAAFLTIGLLELANLIAVPNIRPGFPWMFVGFGTIGVVAGLVRLIGMWPDDQGHDS